jgi:glucose-6-phosphate 1-dehydrogenase
VQGEVKTKLEEFKKISTYVAGAYDEDSAFQDLEKHLQGIEKEYKDGKDINRIYYVRLAADCLLEEIPC